MSARRFFSFLSTFDPITISFVGRMPSKPVYAQQDNINIFIKEIKDLLPKYQQLFLFGAHGTDINGCLINIVNNGINCSIGAAGLSQDAYWGIVNAATGYLGTNFNPSTQGSQFSQNDAGFDIYLSDNTSPSSAWACGVKATNYIGFRLNVEAFAINQAATLARANVPFRAGLHSFNRTASNAVNAQNQNLVNTTGTNVSTARPNGNIHLFECNGVAGSAFVGGICAYGIRSKLTDSEQLRMNNAINDFQIRSLFVKYGASNWGVKMAKSYFLTLHNFEKYEAFEVYEFIKRMQPDFVDGAGTGYYYNTFGPNGQNKTVCDFIMLFKAGGNLVANTWTKTGATLRWNQDGGITNSNTMPAYTRGTNLGIVTVSSTDGWNGVTLFAVNQTLHSVNTFYGNMPKFLGVLKTVGKVGLKIWISRMKCNLIGLPIATLCNGIFCRYLDYPGGIQINMADVIGGQYNNTSIPYMFLNEITTPYNNAIGDLSTLTNEFNGTTTIYLNGSQLTGNLSLLQLYSSLINISIINTSISSGFSSWNKNINTCKFSNNKFTTAANDFLLSIINTYFITTTPIGNLTINISGNLGQPTGGASNPDLLGIIAKHAAAGFTATITI